MIVKKTINAKVIITYGRSLIALNIAQSLGRRGAEIIGCDDVNMTLLSFSKFVKQHLLYASPQKKPAQFIEDLIDIVEKNRPNDGRPYLLIPSFYEARLIAKHRDKFKDIIITIPDFKAINAIDPKDHLAKTLENIDIDSPRTWFPKTQDDINSVAEETEYPVFIKPPDEVGGRGISKVNNASDLKASFKQLKSNYPDKQILVQQNATGRDYCFCGLFDQGTLISSMVYHNNQKFPMKTGAGVVRETVDDELFKPIAAKLMKSVGWHGVCEIDFMWDGNAETTPMLIEVNPRFWSGLDHSIKSNIDFPYELYQLFVDGKVTDKNKVKIGHKTQLPGMSTLAAIDVFMDEAVNFDKLEEEWPIIKKHLHDVNITQAVNLLKESLDEGISIERAYHKFKNMLDETKKAQAISIADDDPFVGLGALFILGSLIRHGTLPPEVLR